MKINQISTLIFSFTFAIFLTACSFGPDKISAENNETNAQIISENNQIDMKIAPKSGDTIATLKTSAGDITMLLYTDHAPETTKNFIELIKSEKYNGVIFHRVMDDFMIQTGDFENSDGTGGYSYKGPGTYLEDEFGKGLVHLRGAVSMANAGKNTGGSQFFIVQKEGGTDWLNGKHAIFGYVYDGMDIVDKIAATKTNSSNKPLEDVVIEEIVVSR